MVADDGMAQMTEQALTFTIEQVAAQTGLTKRTLRYYEEVGLLPPTGRTEGNYRRYTREDVTRLERIKNLRNLLGFSLADIRDILEAEDERQQIREAYRQETEASSKITQLDHADETIRRQLELIEQKITGLEQMRAALQAKLERHAQTRQTLQQQKDI
ncbi:MAG TPA: MerR family transcriptional regulator [Ktedonobacteraceae bacterium]|nr:MerR family transcriptional regulator [Ktedonobacteraceae bacterium]HVU69859.1 MerR family transcriptional regulator [Ktedonobacteraceae bacterium]